MGQAKQRARKQEQWKEALNDEEKTIAEASEGLLLKFLSPSGSTGMCYRMTFFLHLYFAEKGILTEPIVGYINDGTDEIQISHAWLEYRGRKVDLTLSQTERPDINPRGQVLILDHVAKNGHVYFYSRVKNEKAAEVERGWLSDPRLSTLVLHKDLEHREMLKRSLSTGEMRTFLDAAPDGLTFQRLSSFLDA